MIWIMLLTIWILNDPSTQETKVYEVKKIDEEFEIDGKGTSDVWSQAALLTDFQLPWNSEIAQPTFFRALWSETYYYFFYDVIDVDIVSSGKTRDKRNVTTSDRIEIFFQTAAGSMDPYYCLEMDPRGRILGYRAKTYRQFDLDWDWPEGEIEVKANIKSDGYQVEGRISLASLRSLEILNSTGTMDVGLFRGDYYHASSTDMSVRWISWVSPDSPRPDFHIPTAFGKLLLIE